ncbi:MAG TPA: hypothetical protein VL025_21675 [Thermoanaerobaculia bacterium]|nr:hypothetical protein [Thermoanaerobaculia bacterium]
MSRVEKNRLEWIVFAISLLVVLGTVGLLVQDMIRGESSPPELVVELGAPRRQAQGWAVPVTVRNEGGETAEGARVEVTLEVPGREPERAGIDMAFVPADSRREGFVTFAGDPARGRLSGRVVGFERP